MQSKLHFLFSLDTTDNDSSGFGTLAAGIGRVAIRFARRVILPAAKKLGRELLMSAAPELIDVAMEKSLQNKH